MKIIYAQTDEGKIRESFQKALFNRKKEIVKIKKNYLPCYLFELVFESSKKVKKVFVICDSLKGKVRRINWPQPSSPSTMSFQNFSLDELSALKRVKEELSWFSFFSGLRIKRKYHLQEVMELGKIGYPFWLVYFKREGRYNFSVYDGLSGKKEDSLSKEIFLQLFGLQQGSIDFFSRSSKDRQLGPDK